MYFARKHTHLSLEEMGTRMGDRDHTTVMPAVKQIEERWAVDPSFEQRLSEINRTITNG